MFTYMFFEPNEEVFGTTKAAEPFPEETANGRLSTEIRNELGCDRSQKF